MQFNNFPLNPNLPAVASSTKMIPMLPTQIIHDNSPMDYRVEWLVTHAILPPFMAFRYWKNQVVEINDREELIFYRQAELREHAFEIQEWANSGFNVQLAWASLAPNYKTSMGQKDQLRQKLAKNIFSSYTDNPREFAEIAYPYTPTEKLFAHPEEYKIDSNLIQQKVNILILQLRDDLAQLQQLEQEWIACENNWQQIKNKRLQEVNEEQRTVQDAQNKLYKSMDDAEKESIAEERNERRQKREKERRADPASYIDLVAKAELKLEANLLEFRQRNPAPIKDELAHCATEALWKKTLREHLELEDAENISDRYESFEQNLKSAIETYKNNQENR